MSPDEARRKINAFALERGGDLRLARHAALPVSLSPDLLHLIRVNFLLDESNPPPATAEFNLLISPLCREIGDGLYAMDAEVRSVLLAELTLLHGKERLRDIASLLWQYNRRYATWAERPGLERAQQLAALAFLDPHEAQSWLERTESELLGTTPVERQWFVAMRRELTGVVQPVQEASDALSGQGIPSDINNIQDSKTDQIYKGHILVIDDDIALQVVLEYALRNKGYKVTLASDGLNALSVIESENFNLIIVDTHMPIMDGVEFFNRVKERLQDDGIPIIVMTAVSRKPWFADLEAEGAVILQKPFDVDRLIDMINITLADSSTFTKSNVAHNKPSVIPVLTQNDLLKIARIRGYLAFQEIQLAFPTPETGVSTIDALYERLRAHNLMVIDDKNINPVFTVLEQHILELLNRSDVQIAERLSLTENEVKARITNIFVRLGARNRTEAIALAQFYNPLSLNQQPSETRLEVNKSRYKYDVVLSFAGEDRKHANKVAQLLKKLDIKVFYDTFVQSDLWGKDLYEYLDDVYSNKARYCIMFLSEHYAKKLWTNHERKSAQERAFTENREYILPVRIDDTKIPGIRSTQGFLDLRKHSYQDVVTGVLHKLGKAVEEKPKGKPPQKPAIPKKPTVDPTIPLHPIKKTFTDEEKGVLLTRAFATIKRYFQAGLRTYNAKDKDVTGEITTVDAKTFICTINVRGTQRNQCKIWIGESYRSQGIYYAQGRMNTQYNTNAYNHSFHVADDGYKLFIQSSMMHTHLRQPENNQLTQRDAARQLWEIFIEPLKH